MAGFADLLKGVLSGISGGAARVGAAYGNPSALNDEYTQKALARQQGMDALTKQEMQQKLQLGQRQLDTTPSTPEEAGWVNAKPITNAEDSILREQNARTGQVRQVKEMAPAVAPQPSSGDIIPGVSSESLPSKPVTGPEVPTPVRITTPLDVLGARSNAAYILQMLRGGQMSDRTDAQQAGANSRNTERVNSKEVEGGANRDAKAAEGNANRESKETIANQTEGGKAIRWGTQSGNNAATNAAANTRNAASNASRERAANPFGSPTVPVTPPSGGGEGGSPISKGPLSGLFPSSTTPPLPNSGEVVPLPKGSKPIAGLPGSGNGGGPIRADQAQYTPAQATLQAMGVNPIVHEAAMAWSANPKYEPKVGKLHDAVAAYMNKNDIPSPGDKLTAANLGRKQISQTLLSHIPAIRQEINALQAKGKLGPLAGRWNELISGTPFGDPDYTKLHTELTGMLSSGTMMGHVGARGSEGMLKEFKSKMDAGKMDGPSLNASLDGVESFLNGYAHMGEGGNAGPGTKPPSTTPNNSDPDGLLELLKKRK